MKQFLIFAVATTANLFSFFAIAGGTGDHSHDHGHSGKYSVGEPTTDKPDRTIDVSMVDTMRFVFTPDFKDLHAGEVIAFNIKNDGAIVHEFSIGNAEEQVAHAEMMRNMPNMKHEDPNTISLKPGESGQLVWRFTGDETVVFACNEVGHFEAGMRHDLKIKDKGHSH